MSESANKNLSSLIVLAEKIDQNWFPKKVSEKEESPILAIDIDINPATSNGSFAKQEIVGNFQENNQTAIQLAYQKQIQFKTDLLKTTNPHNSSEIDERIELFLRNYKGPYKNLFKQFKQSYHYERWPIYLKDDYNEKLNIGFKYCEQFMQGKLGDNFNKNIREGFKLLISSGPGIPTAL